MIELGPLVAEGLVGIPVAHVDGVFGRIIVGDVDELEDKGPSSHDTAAARQKVPADNVLEDGRLSG